MADKNLFPKSLSELEAEMEELKLKTQYGFVRTEVWARIYELRDLIKEYRE